MVKLSQNEIKHSLGEKAALLIESGMRVGLGSGSTSHYFIKALAKRCTEENIKITTAASSQNSALLGQQEGLTVLDLNIIGNLDITVDGADEVDPQKQLIKGAGGAHVREKIVAAMSQELVILVDESKLVDQLGKTKLPVEILSFGKEITKKHLEKLNLTSTWRMSGNDLFVTDNGNYLLDIHFPSPPDNPKDLEKQICAIPGVIDTGFFFDLVGRIFIGFADGQIIVKQ